MSNGATTWIPHRGLDGLEERRRYLVFSELCNECGNCLTFCPEHGDPALVKPRLCLDRSRLDAATGPRFLLRDNGGHGAIAGGGADAELPILLELPNAAEGLPLDRVPRD